MEVSLASQCQGRFGHTDRLRGKHYFKTERVTLTAIGSLGATAVALGSSGEEYDVWLDFSQLEDHEELGVYCDCARFAQGEYCKHLWAMILQADKYVQLNLPPKTELYLYECDPELHEIGSPLSRRIDLSLPATTRQTGPRAGASWREVLSQLASRERNRSTTARLKPLERIKESQYWFSINLANVVESPWFSINVHHSTRKKDGEWSVPSKICISRAEVDSIRDPDCCRIFSLLQWTYLQNGYRYGIAYAPILRFSPPILGETLRALCDTGRFVWTMDGDRTFNDYRTLTYDGGGEWCLAVRVQPGDDDSLQISPELHRTDELGERQTREIGDVVAVCDSGAILFAEQIGNLRPGDSGWVRVWQRTQKLDVPHPEFGAFLREILSIQSAPELILDESLGIERVQQQPMGKLVLSSPENPQEKYLTATVRFKYPGGEVNPDEPSEFFWNENTKTIVRRDSEAEHVLLGELNSFAFHEVYYRFDEKLVQVHRKWFSELVQYFTGRSWEVIADGKRLRRPGNFSIKVESGEDWFDLQADIDFDGVRSPLPTLLQALQRGESFVVLDDGTRGILPEEWLRKFGGLAEMGQVEGDAVRFQSNQALMLDLLLAEQQQVSVDKNFSAWCAKLKGFSGINPASQPRGFRGDLREYQREGLGWFAFLNEFRFGGCLADDMGLGKTIQVLAWLERRRARRLKKGESRKPSLAVVPKSLVFNWIEEAGKFCPKLRVLDYTGTQRAERLQELDHCHLIVTTYATFRRDVQKLKDIEFDYAILDEAQAIKNPSAQATKAVRLLQADHRLAMTGTPVENHLGDLWSLFDFLNPGMLGGITANTFMVSGDDQAERLTALSNALRPFVLRRTKQQVLSELPEKTEQTLYCEMNVKQKKLYQELRDHYRASLTKKIKDVGIKRSKIHVLEALLRLRQAACDPRLVRKDVAVMGAKIEFLIEQLQWVLSEGHKALVFSQFTSLLALLKKELTKNRWKFEYLDGQSNRRAESVKRFQEDPECSLFLISLKAGGHGLNLTAADYVYILDPWWNPAVEAQAIDRAHRMGQQKPVVAYRMIAKGTVEDKIVQLQQTKRQLADAIISADQSLIRTLSMDDLQILFE